MVRIGTLQDSLANRRALRLPNGAGYFKSDFIVSQPGDAVAPQAFLIEQEANSVIRAHFHQENQFQVVVDGGAMLGKHEVAPVSLHYASRHTGYGPITAGPRGVSYFSLRDRVTADAYYLPESRELMEDVPRRNVFAERVEVLDAAALRALRRAELSEVIEAQPDGVAAWEACIPPGDLLRVAAPAGGADRFHMVLSGSIRLAGAWLPRLATIFSSADEPALDLLAGPAGAQVLVMQYPAPPARPSAA